MNLKLKINKVDLITIVLLCIVFLSIATVNLGLTQAPTSTTEFTDGQSFYLDLGTTSAVKSMAILLKYGAFNVTVTPGSPGNWQQEEATNSAKPYNNQEWSEEYYKWQEVSFWQTTQYLKVDFSQAGYSTIIAEIAVISQDDQQIPIQSVHELSGDNPDLNNVADEQNMIQYPFDYMSQTYFDEIYFVRTAEQYLNAQLPYEWTHPPLGKLIQAAGIVAFGFTPFGWRIMGVIFATLMIALVYLLGKELIGTWIGGFTAAFLITFDFMHFTMARMGTADTYVVFFTVAYQLFFLIYLKNVFKDGWKTSTLPLLLTFIFFGLAFASKWLVLYGFIGALFILVVMRLNEARKLEGFSEKVYGFLDRPYSQVVAFVLIAIGVYFLTYIPDMIAGRSFFDVLGLQGSMYAYHSGLTATHSFSSPWYSWPLLFDPINANVHVPLWLQSATFPDIVTKSTIVALGNPAVWWVGFGAIISITVIFLKQLLQPIVEYLRSLIKHTTKKVSFKIEMLPAVLVVLFFFQWLPNALISRVLFIYHFYPCVPLLCVASAFLISKYWNNKWVKLLAVVYFALVVALFVLFYPVISGVPTPTSTIDSLKWAGSWVF
jgi:dolichyl-phosphate-mannose-protein mannosyltransferase